jgi:hypothetical protein
MQDDRSRIDNFVESELGRAALTGTESHLWAQAKPLTATPVPVTSCNQEYPSLNIETIR